MPTLTLTPFQGESLVGQKFNHLTVLEYVGKDVRTIAHWNCRCDCGKTVIVAGPHLKKENTKSCGCIKVVRAKAGIHWTHRKSQSRVYHIWNSMVARCSNKNNHKYPRYGGRGISVCERWLKFENFLADMQEPPTVNHQIERVDNDGNYEPDNCVWATRIVQARNRSDNHRLTHNGKTLTLAEWAEITGIKYGNIKNRINNLGWSVSDALTRKEKHLWRG